MSNVAHFYGALTVRNPVCAVKFDMPPTPFGWWLICGIVFLWDEIVFPSFVVAGAITALRVAGSL